jgi:hypothetical protein
VSFICKNGAEHRHDTSEEARRCWFPPALPPPATVPVAGPVRPYEHPEPSTGAQHRYVEILQGDVGRARLMTKRECSTYIDRLKAGTEPKITTPAATPPPAVRKEPTPKQKMIAELLKGVPDGRFAVRLDESTPWTFVRISRPKPESRSNYRGATKVQTQHGPSLSDPKFVIWPSGVISSYEYTIEDTLLLVVADYRGAARAYARELGRCCRCATELTDQRSRHYGIGPECEQHWPWIIEMVDSEESIKNGG